jgi:hypothetical protein
MPPGERSRLLQKEVERNWQLRIYLFIYGRNNQG